MYKYTFDSEGPSVNISPETYIKEARYFQANGQYDLAISELEKAQSYDSTKKYYVEIQKSICYNYRKIGDFNLALLHINYAINYLLKSSLDNEKNKDYAICLMNKGVVFEEQSDVPKAEECYLLTLKIFKYLCLDQPDDYGLLINAYFTVDAFYYQQQKYDAAFNYFNSALPYFVGNKEDDRIYIL